MLYLDTHTVIWLYAKELGRFHKNTLQYIEECPLYISPAVLLELQFLEEIKRIDADPMLIFQTLEETIDLQLCDLAFSKVITGALSQSWTRDPFDRMIVAQASIQNAALLTKDRAILKHYAQACWK
ncbi:MAG: PIN domain-containing protein [Kiritimatiellales bacterium]